MDEEILKINIKEAMKYDPLVADRLKKLDKKDESKMIEIDTTKLERGTHEGRVKVTREGKTFWRKQRLGTRDSPRMDTGKIASLPDDMKKEILSLRADGFSGEAIKLRIENLLDLKDDPDDKFKESLGKKGILLGTGINKDVYYPVRLNVTGQALTDWAKVRGVFSPNTRKTVEDVEFENKETKDEAYSQFQKLNDKLAASQVENKHLKEEIDRLQKSKMVSDKLRSEHQAENFILRQKLKSYED